MPRPLKKNVEFFYHRCAPNKVVRIMKRNFGMVGYAFYYQLRELLGDAKYHNYALNSELDWQDFLSIMVMDEEEANEIIELLIKVDELDEELWKNEKRLFSHNFVDRLKVVYDKRDGDMPNKYSFRDGNAIYSTETPVSGSEIPKERETYTTEKDTYKQTRRKRKNKKTNFIAECTECDFDFYVDSVDQRMVCRKNRDHGKMVVNRIS